MAVERFTDGLGCLNIPKDDESIKTTRRQLGAVRAESYTLYIICMSVERLTDALACLYIPQADGVISTAERQPGDIRTESHTQ
jgi:hypothetical protein